MCLNEVERKLCVDDDFSAGLRNGFADYPAVLDAVGGSLAALEKLAESLYSINKPTLCCRSCIFGTGYTFGGCRSLDEMGVK